MRVDVDGELSAGILFFVLLSSNSSVITTPRERRDGQFSFYVVLRRLSEVNLKYVRFSHFTLESWCT
jgi:hypothetical protein